MELASSSATILSNRQVSVHAPNSGIFDRAVHLICVALTAAFFISNTAQATPLTFENLETLEYREPAADRHHLDPNEDKQLTAELVRMGYVETTGAFRELCRKLRINHIYSSEDLGRTIFVRYDLELKDRSRQGELISLHPRATLYHASTSQKTPFAVMFLGFKKTELTPLINRLTTTRPIEKETRKKRSAFALLNLAPYLIREARAAENCDAHAEEHVSALGSMGAAALRYAGDCLSGAKDGMYDALVGDVANLFNGTFWNSVVGMYQAVRTIWRDFATEIASQYQGLEKHPDLLFKLFCETLGGIAGSVVLTGATAGAASGASATARAVRVVEAINKLLERSEGIRSAVNRTVTSSGFSKEYIAAQCVTRVPVPERVTASVAEADDERFGFLSTAPISHGLRRRSPPAATSSTGAR